MSDVNATVEGWALRRLNASLPLGSTPACWLLETEAPPSPLLRSSLAGWSAASLAPPPLLLLLPPSRLQGLGGCELVSTAEDEDVVGQRADSTPRSEVPQPPWRLAIASSTTRSPLLTLRLARRLAALLSCAEGSCGACQSPSLWSSTAIG